MKIFVNIFCREWTLYQQNICLYQTAPRGIWDFTCDRIDNGDWVSSFKIWLYFVWWPQGWSLISLGQCSIVLKGIPQSGQSFAYVRWMFSLQDNINCCMNERWSSEYRAPWDAPSKGWPMIVFICLALRNYRQIYHEHWWRCQLVMCILQLSQP